MAFSTDVGLVNHVASRMGSQESFENNSETED